MKEEKKKMEMGMKMEGEGEKEREGEREGEGGAAGTRWSASARFLTPNRFGRSAGGGARQTAAAGPAGRAARQRKRRMGQKEMDEAENQTDIRLAAGNQACNLSDTSGTNSSKL